MKKKKQLNQNNLQAPTNAHKHINRYIHEESRRENYSLQWSYNKCKGI